MVALNVLYNTGARDEDPKRTGMAHLIEHLMFSGSANVPDFDGELQRAGGSSNAWTSNDFTCFYEVIPAVNAEVAFRVESDRMLAPAINRRNLEIQRSVVIEEFKQQCLNRPYGDMSHHLRRLAYTRHPYRWPVIGLEPSHLERITLDDVTGYINRHYSVSNAVMAVTGNITADECERLCRKWMGDIPGRPVPVRQHSADSIPAGGRREHVDARVPQTALTLAYLMNPYGTPGYRAADALTDVLSNGRSSRFEQRLLTGTDIFSELDASITGSEEQGLLMVSARLRDPHDVDRAIDAIDGELQRLVDDGVTPHELERAKNKFESNYIFGNLHYARRAQTLAIETMHGEQPGRGSVDAYRALKPADLHLTARRLFTAPRVTLTYGPA